MLKITRIYNQNRFKIWKIAIIVIFIIAIIQLYNDSYLMDGDKKIVSVEENSPQFDIVDYEKASNSIVSNGVVQKEVRDEIQKVLENFLVFCCNGQVEEAYGLLTDNCKEILYPTSEIFNEKYCKNLYENKKTYSFQSWSTENYNYVYLVKIFEDMLSSGRDNTKNYIQDYITVVRQDGEYLLNINKFINVKRINRQAESQDVKIKVINSQVYMDYEIYEIEVKNNRDKDIILDPVKEDDSTYILNQDLVKIRALLYENKQEDFRVAPGETKKISIKFNNTFIASNYVNKLVFANVIIDEEKYDKDSKNKEAIMQLEVNVKV